MLTTMDLLLTILTCLIALPLMAIFLTAIRFECECSITDEKEQFADRHKRKIADTGVENHQPMRGYTCVGDGFFGMQQSYLCQERE